ncbi:ribosome silencing factor [Blattabacterium cuenoti]|uniref:ribosome silencing factor n=1 Tax=Blattabacterium cuenoti TaxID=1653831 RepID=UPI00163C8D65|nr:ribosome silencing factor [Blattabacterium cuenoti]
MLLKKIVEGIKIVKGSDISILNLKNKENFICDYFVICNGYSKNQVFAIFHSIEQIVIETFKKKPIRVEGKRNREWILIDYESIIVHIFQKKTRLYYNIENIWS